MNKSSVTKPYAYIGSNWAGNGPVAYKSKLQSSRTLLQNHNSLLQQTIQRMNCVFVLSKNLCDSKKKSQLLSMK